jgi:preprotein translocase SecE subunit
MAKKENFFQGVKSEMEKTSWPTKEELFKYTVIVVASFLAIYKTSVYFVIPYLLIPCNKSSKYNTLNLNDRVILHLDWN